MMFLLRTMRAFAVCACLIATCDAMAATATIQQTLTLQPGWNAVQLQLAPDERDFATVFDGVPVHSVWRWRPEQGGAQFIRDPAEGLQNLAGWYGWYPAGKPAAFLSNLFRFEPLGAYLIKLEGTTPATIVLAGKPLYRATDWQIDAFTLTGLPVDPANPPSFGEYFQRSAAHAGQPVYVLEPTGRWRLVASPASEVARPGVAYWIYTKGKSGFHGSMRVVLDNGGDAIDFGSAGASQRFVLRNLADSAGSFTLETTGTLPLMLRGADDPVTHRQTWTPFASPTVFGVAGNGSVFVELAAKSAELEQAQVEDILSIRDEQGGLLRLHLRANDPGASAASTGLLGSPDGGEADPLAGLWAGIVSVDAVSESQRGQFAIDVDDSDGDGDTSERIYIPDVPGSEPTPAKRSFAQRVLIHVDADGHARLLKDAILMWKEGTTRPSAEDPDYQEVDAPGHYVLVTDKTRLSLFDGATVRDNVSVGQRFSTIAYDFDGDTLALTGSFAPGQTLNAGIELAASNPTNPFLHRYHPDHDNLDEQRQPQPAGRTEAYAVTRAQSYVFDAEDPDGGNEPSWGAQQLSGVFRETLTGLHRVPITVSGRFQLQRISNVAVLNDGL